MPPYYGNYIHLADDVHYLQALEISLQDLYNAPIKEWIALENKVYAPGKWTVKDILQHCIDTERVFIYRASAFARGDKQRMLSFDENLYAQNAKANIRTIEDLVEEFILLRKGSIAFYKFLDQHVLNYTGFVYDGTEVQVLALAFMIIGHHRWHTKVIEEKYIPLLAH